MDQWLITLGDWIYVIIIMVIFTITLYKENPIYGVVESLGVGVSAGNGVLLAWRYLANTTFTPLIGGNYLLIIPVILGILLFARLTRYGWLSRYTSAVLVGGTTGLFLVGVTTTNLLNNLTYLAQPTGRGVDNIILNIIFTVTIIGYFIFIRERKGAMGYLSYAGRKALIIVIGASLGRMTMLFWGWLYPQVVQILITTGIAKI